MSRPPEDEKRNHFLRPDRESKAPRDTKFCVSRTRERLAGWRGQRLSGLRPEMKSQPWLVASAILTFALPVLDIAAWTWAWITCSLSLATSGIPRDKQKRVVVLADPQLTDRTSYESLPGGPLLAFVEFICDVYLARSALATASLLAWLGRPEAAGKWSLAGLWAPTRMWPRLCQRGLPFLLKPSSSVVARGQGGCDDPRAAARRGRLPRRLDGRRTVVPPHHPLPDAVFPCCSPHNRQGTMPGMSARGLGCSPPAARLSAFPASQVRDRGVRGAARTLAPRLFRPRGARAHGRARGEPRHGHRVLVLRALPRSLLGTSLPCQLPPHRRERLAARTRHGAAGPLTAPPPTAPLTQRACPGRSRWLGLWSPSPSESMSGPARRRAQQWSTLLHRRGARSAARGPTPTQREEEDVQQTPLAGPQGGGRTARGPWRPDAAQGTSTRATPACWFPRATPRTDWTRLVLPPVLSGHVSSTTACWFPRAAPRRPAPPRAVRVPRAQACRRAADPLAARGAQLTHLPLYRSGDASCGPKRRSQSRLRFLSRVTYQT